MIKRVGVGVIFALLVLLAGCGGSEGPKNHYRGVYMLIDTSGTYTKELVKAQNIIKFLLTRLNPGDSFAVARIDTGSFSEKDIIAKVTFDDRPSMANQQKRIFSDEVDDFVKTVKPASFTDITGAVLQAIEFLNEKGPGKKTILISKGLMWSRSTSPSWRATTAIPSSISSAWHGGKAVSRPEAAAGVSPTTWISWRKYLPTD